MKRFLTLELSDLLDMYSGLTDYNKRLTPADPKTQEFKDFENTILLVHPEIEHRQQPQCENDSGGY